MRRGALAARLRDGVSDAAARPQHVGLGALVVGLLLGPHMFMLAVVVATTAAGAALVGWPERQRSGARVLATPVSSSWSGGPAPRRVRPVVLVAAVTLLLGAGLGAARVAALEHTALGPSIGHAVDAEVVVQDAPRTSRFGGWSALVRWRGEPVLLRVSDRGRAGLPDVGARVAVTGGLQPPDEFAQHRHAHAVLRSATVRVVGRRGGGAGWLDGVRRRAEGALAGDLPPQAAGLFRGMVLGQDAALPDATREAFRASGLSHLVAASGTNVVLLAALATALASAAGLGLSGRLWLVLALIAVYVPLAGGGASIQRAGIMGAAAVAAGLAGRPASRWYALGLAAAVTLVLDPRAAGDPGWQLSFVAVLSLLLVAPRWRAALVRAGAPGPLADVTAMTAAATLATAPVVAAHFGQASLVGLPANLLAAPVVAPVMWLGVAAAGLAQLTVLGGPVVGAVAWGTDVVDAVAGFPLGYLLAVADGAAAAPGAVFEVGAVPVLGVVVVVCAILGSGRVRRVVPALAVAGLLAWLGLAPAAASPPPAPDGFRLTFLDVGQGDATLLQDGAVSVLVDTGLPDAGVVARLRAAGVRRLDLLVVTHADADHAGGAPAVLGDVPVGLLLDGRDGVQTPVAAAVGEAAGRAGTPLLAPRAGQVLRLGELVLRVLWPRAEAPALHAGANPNERAIVLEAQAEGVRVLLPADAESDVLARLPLERVDVLKVAHHGSADPGLPGVLARLRPRVAGIEVGRGNTYGHPTASALAALARVPVVVRTDRDGTVRLDRTASGSWEVRAHA